MLQKLIAKYEPINTTEKVDALISDMQASNIYITSSVSFEVLVHINKAKTQMYFRDTIQPLLKAEPKVNPIINASANRVTYNGGYNIEYVSSGKSSKKKKKKEKAEGVQTLTPNSPPVPSRRDNVVEVPGFVESFKQFGDQADVEKFIKVHESKISTSIIDCWLKYVDKYINPVKLKIYFRKRMFDLMDEIKSKGGGSPCTRMRMEQEKRNEEQNRYTQCHIISIPMGGQNKKY